MSNFTGMDIGQVRQLAAQFQTKAGEIDSLRQQLTSQLEATAWVGPDATRFRSEWAGQHVAALNQVAEALRQASQVSTRNAQEQEQASNT